MKLKRLKLFALKLRYQRKSQALRTLFHIEGAKFFKKGQFQGCLKQLNLEQNPG